MTRRFAFLVLTALTIAAYWNSFNAPLVFDDLVTITRNSMVRAGQFNWDLKGLLGARSILYASFTVNFLVSGMNTWSYHVFNLLLHLANGFMIFLLADRILDNRKYAVLAAGLFLVHPVQTEAVTYISSRSELLSTFFFIAGLLVFVFWPWKRGFLCALAVGVPYFFALGSKETAVTLPACILLYDLIFLETFPILWRNLLRQRWRFYLLYALGTQAAAYYIADQLRGSIGGTLPGHLSTWTYFLTQTRVICTYIRLLFWPVGLNLDYDFRPSMTFWDGEVISCSLFLCGCVFLAWKIRRTHPVFAFSIAWFFVTLAPTSSFVSILDVIFEHRLYLPLVGVCLSFPLLIEWICSLRKEFTFSLSCLILAVLVSATVQRNYVWSDEPRVLEYRP